MALALRVIVPEKTPVVPFSKLSTLLVPPVTVMLLGKAVAFWQASSPWLPMVKVALEETAPATPYSKMPPFWIVMLPL